MSACIPLIDTQNPPNWWDPPVPPTPPEPFFYHLEDRPWWSAHRRNFGLGAAEEAVFLAFHHVAPGRSSLYLSWGVRFAAGSSPERDRLYVAFAPFATAAPLLLEVVVYSEDRDLRAAPAARIAVGTLDADGRFQSLPRQPAWVTETTRVWRHLATNQWGVQMRVPVAPGAAPGDDAGIDVGPDGHLRIWYCLDVYTPLNPAGGSVNPAGGILRMGWPEEAQGSFAAGQGAWPVPALYEDYALGGQRQPSCASGRSLSLHWLTMGTPNVTASQLDLEWANTVFARPTNRSGAELAAGQARGRFALANWGSVCATGPAWTPVALDIPNDAAIADGKTPVQGQDIRYKWELPDDLAEAFRSGARPLNQCLRVELSGAGPVLTNPVVCRNMDFVGDTRFSREAEISVVGMEPISALPRDVYLAVEVYNLPERVDPATVRPKASATNAIGLGVRADPDGDPTSVLEDHVNALNAYAYDMAMVPTPEVGQIMLDANLPTYRVHCYHDTGRREHIDGRSYCVLGLQGSFGYHLVLGGEPQGWSHRLRGAIRLAERFYVLRVPNGGAARVTTSIRALEAGEIPEPDEPIQAWPLPPSGSDRGRLYWLIALVVIALLVLGR